MNNIISLRYRAPGHLSLAGLVLIISLLVIGSPAIAADGTTGQTSQIPELVVIGSANQADTVDVTPGVGAIPTPDSMDIIGRLPGAAVNTNGPLSGQAQYRGLSGPRLNVLVDDMKVTPGGFNWMDSPMHYSPPGLTKQITLTRGIAPVSSGPGIGGLIQAKTKKAEFTSDHDLAMQGDLVGAYMTNNGWATSGVLGAANVNHRFNVVGSIEQGDDMEFGNGTVAGTEYERSTVGTGYGYRWGYNDVSVDYTYTDTGLTGTPALPLDIEFFKTHRINIGSNLNIGGAEVTARVFYTDIDHGMNNYELRTPPDNSVLPLPPFQGTEERKVDVEAEALGFVLKSTFDVGSGELNVGIDGNMEEHTGLITDPDPSAAAFFVENFNNAGQDNYGIFAEFLTQLSEDWFMEFGVRYQRTESSADAVDAQPAGLCGTPPFLPGTMPGMAPCAVALLRNQFNNADRDIDDNNFEAVLRFDYSLNDNMTLNMGYARKTRAPSYIEYFLWIPLEINSGLGDFNNYVGNLDLDSEKSDQIELGIEWTFERGNANPRVYYRYVEDYIQGIASTSMAVIGVSGNANGDPTPLQFANTRAEIYGFDMPVRYRLTDSLTLDGTISYTRGKNKKLDDDLYRIAPLNGRLALTYGRSNWAFTAENVLMASQSKISRTIVFDEPRSNNSSTSGWGILNLYGQWLGENGLQVRVGLENIFDKDYTLHTSGFNRNMPSDVPIGDRLPGRGINGFANVSYNW